MAAAAVGIVLLILQMCGRTLWGKVLPMSFWVATLDDRDLRLRQRALEIVSASGAAGAPASPALAGLREKYGDGWPEQVATPSIQSYVMILIGAIDFNATGCLEGVVADEILTKLGVAAKEPLLRAARAPRDRHGPAAVTALSHRFSSDPQVESAFVELLKHPRPAVRERAAQALGRPVPD